MEIKSQKIVNVISSHVFFLLAVIVFSVQAAWLSLTVRFPMAYDEAYHLGLIKFYSHHLNPIITSQPQDSYKFGAIIQNPSFLYHYSLSFLDRFISIFTSSTVIHVMGLRLINVVFIVISLFVMRRLLLALNFSSGLSNVIVILFAFTPIVIALSAQINYDNLVILLVSICVYQTVVIFKEYERKVFNAKRLIFLISLCLFSSLVKYSFLPIFAAIVFLLIWKLLVTRKKYGLKVYKNYKNAFVKINRAQRTLLVLILLSGSLLFTRFYIYNIVRYSNPIPQCNQILKIDDCKQYYAWDQNYTLEQYKLSHPKLKRRNIVYFSGNWLISYYFSVYGESKPLYGIFYISPIFTLVVGLFAFFATIFTLGNLKKIFKDNPSLIILLVVSLLYTGALWSRNYHDYLHLDQIVAISGRYIIPVLVFIYAILAFGFRKAIGNQKNRLVPKTILATIILLLFLTLGGFTPVSYTHLY